MIHMFVIVNDVSLAVDTKISMLCLLMTCEVELTLITYHPLALRVLYFFAVVLFCSLRLLSNCSCFCYSF